MLKRMHLMSAATFILIFFAFVGLGSLAGNGKDTVYAVKTEELDQTSDEDTVAGESKELQIGLMGIVDSVNNLEAYSQAASCMNMETANEEILVGTGRVKKNAIYQKQIEKSAKTISNIGYAAQQVVRDNQMDSTNYFTLLQIVEAEATGGDLKSKTLIADVILNRVADSRFPDTIYDVVWQQAGGSPQFSPTADGRIYSVEITDDTIQAVDDALSGTDYSEGALFFVARSSADASNLEWFDTNLTPLFDYGGHEYFTFAE